MNDVMDDDKHGFVVVHSILPKKTGTDLKEAEKEEKEKMGVLMMKRKWGRNRTKSQNDIPKPRKKKNQQPEYNNDDKNY